MFANTNDAEPTEQHLVYVFNCGTGEKLAAAKMHAVDVVQWMEHNPLGKVEYKWQ